MSKITIKIESIECDICKRNIFKDKIKMVLIHRGLRDLGFDFCEDCYSTYEVTHKHFIYGNNSEMIELNQGFFAIKNDKIK